MGKTNGSKAGSVRATNHTVGSVPKQKAELIGASFTPVQRKFVESGGAPDIIEIT